LTSEQRKHAIRGPIPHLRLRVAQRHEGARLGHPVPLDDPDPDVVEPADHRLGDGGPANDHAKARGELPASRVLLQGLDDPEPDRRNAGGERHLLPFHEVEEALGIQVRTGEHLARTEHRQSEWEPPRVHVEHRNDGHHDIGLAETHRDCLGEGVEHERTMRVEDPLQPARGTGGVTEADGVGLREGGQRRERRVPGEELFVVFEPRRNRLPRERNDEDPFGVHLVPHLLEDGKQHVVDQDPAVPGVVDHVGQMIGGKAEVERVKHSPRRGHPEVRLEMRRVIPHEGRDPVARPKTFFDNRPGQRASPANYRRVVGVPNAPVRRSRRDGDGREKPFRPREKGAERERIVIHHQAVHLVRSASGA